MGTDVDKGASNHLGKEDKDLKALETDYARLKMKLNDLSQKEYNSRTNLLGLRKERAGWTKLEFSKSSINCWPPTGYTG